MGQGERCFNKGGGRAGPGRVGQGPSVALSEASGLGCKLAYLQAIFAFFLRLNLPTRRLAGARNARHQPGTRPVGGPTALTPPLAPGSP
jgi:hypothetical protein